MQVDERDGFLLILAQDRSEIAGERRVERFETLDDILPCHESHRLDGREMPNPDLTPRVYTEMCPKINWYAGLTLLPLLERRAYEAELAEVRGESFRLRALCPYLAD